MQARERKPPLLEDQFVKKVTVLSESHPTPRATRRRQNATTDLKESEVSFALKHDKKEIHTDPLNLGESEFQKFISTASNL